MTKTYLYVVRHGKTMFNSLGRAQGWSDTPLTKSGREGIRALGCGFKELGLSFDRAFSSDSGRAVETLDLILEELGQDLPRVQDKRIREWCFGSMEGLYDAELFHGVLPHGDAFAGRTLAAMPYPEIAERLYEIDTAGWAEPWEVLRDRIWQGFGEMAEQTSQGGGGKALVVCHGMTISTLLWLIDPDQEKTMIANGSVTLLTYEDGRFGIERVSDLTYLDRGKEIGHEAP